MNVLHFLLSVEKKGIGTASANLYSILMQNNVAFFISFLLFVILSLRYHPRKECVPISGIHLGNIYCLFINTALRILDNTDTTLVKKQRKRNKIFLTVQIQDRRRHTIFVFRNA